MYTPESPWADLKSIAGEAVRYIRSLIASDVELEGELHCTAEDRDDWADVLTVGGTFKGKVSGYDAIIVDPDGHMEGGVEATTVVINGTLKGQVHAPRRVELQEHARFYGNLSPMPDILVISPRATFGHDEHHTDPLADTPQ